LQGRCRHRRTARPVDRRGRRDRLDPGAAATVSARCGRGATGAGTGGRGGRPGAGRCRRRGGWAAGGVHPLRRRRRDRGADPDGATVSVLVAPAGTGKTTTVGAAVAAWQSEGHRVLALAPSARAAKELGTATGLPGYTVAKFLHEQHVDRDPRDPAWFRYRVG